MVAEIMSLSRTRCTTGGGGVYLGTSNVHPGQPCQPHSVQKGQPVKPVKVLPSKVMEKRFSSRAPQAE